ncbi:MAG TPA: PAS domain-containing protein [Thermodesulfatator sp.]|nr:PAS domain-containing protein [Thermodesulfatator sp.]
MVLSESSEKGLSRPSQAIKEKDSSWAQAEKVPLNKLLSKVTTISEPAFLTSEMGMIIEANQAFEDCLRLPRQEILGASCYKLIHGTNQRPPSCPFSQKGTPALRIPFFWRGGLYLILLKKFRDSEGRGRYLLHTLKEVDGYKELNPLGLLDHLPLPIFRMEPRPDGHLLSVNQALRQWLGQNELNGQRLASFAMDVSAWEKMVQQLLSGEIIKGVEMGFRGPQGRPLWGAIYASLTFDQTGQPESICGVIRDISQEVRQRIIQRAAEDIRNSHYRLISRLKQQLQNLTYRLLEAQEDERRRISMEIHDGIGQVLSAVRYTLEHVLVSHQQGRGLEAPKIEEALELLDKVMQETRHIILNLRPPLLDDLGLEATLRWYIDHVTSGTNLTCQLFFEVEEEAIPEAYKIILYRITQEALSNVIKHARADSVSIRLKRDGKRILLTIEDNGIGFNPQEENNQQRPGGYGLMSIRQRACFVGATFEIHSRPGEGTKIEVGFPI